MTTMQIDVSGHRNADGELYYPSYPWGVHMHVQGCEPTNGGPLASNKAKTKTAAMEQAQRHVVGKPGHSAEVFRRRDGQVRIRYWWDDQLQYIEY